MTPVSSHSPHGQSPLRTVQVLGGGNAGSSAHVRSLAAGLVARGVTVTVCAPSDAECTYDFTGTGAEHVHVPRSSDPVSVAALRAVCADADLVHAHGLHASFRAVLALGGRRVRTPLVVTWHDRAHAEGARAHLLRALERRVMKAATVVLGTTSGLVDGARGAGARDARLGPVALPVRPGSPAGPEDPDRLRPKLRAELGAVERPLLVAVGSLERHRGYDVLLDAARVWRRLDPAPLVVVAGEGPLRAELQGRIESEGLPVLLAGRRDDVPDLLAAADLALLPARRETGRSLLAQEALHACVPLVAAEVGGIPELVGDAAELVPAGDGQGLADAVVRLLGDPGRRDELRARGVRQAATWPTEDETVAQVLSVYDELTQPTPLL
ncbi:glycosyltransferase family 4 protein [Strepomyces sp. STD 3.1]|uniref:glycosyltransferase family 4 protein n=1 Tax=Streptomyces sp. NPDC058985 TaxID=3346684 RepID=UPI001F37FC5A|nr:glycosyltransferase family 4 protein [Streptomyces sp. STD 3.1]